MFLQAKKVGQAGQQYARDNLLPQDVFCYHALLFKVVGTGRVMGLISLQYFPL